MSDDKYSIDDILKEIDTHRSSDGNMKSSFDGSVTDIIGGNEIDRALRVGSQKKSKTAKQDKPDISVTAVINSISAKNKKDNPPLAARQRTEEEFEERVAGDIAGAIDKREKSAPKEDVILPAKQRTEEEVNERIAKEISEAADIKIWERLREEDNDVDEEGVRTYEPGSAHEPLNVENSHSEDDSSDEIVFQESLVTTDTMQLRKQRKIEEINKALLKVDSEAESPDDMLASLNPMESRAKATEQLKGDVDENTDTLAVGGNDLKRIASRGDEKIKEYRPSAARKKEPDNRADEVLFSAGAQRPAFPGGLHVGETIVDALNKKIREDKKEEKERIRAEKNPRKYAAEAAAAEAASADNSEKTENDASADNTGSIPAEDTQSGKISLIASASEESDTETETGEESTADKIKLANELAKKKKRRIANFILEDMGSDTEELERSRYDDEEEDEDDVEEPVDLDDENVIRDRLSRASKGLISRLLILAALYAATLFIAIVNQFRINLGTITNIVSYRVAPENYLYAHLTIGILSFAACSSVISNGFSRLFKFRPDGDTLCALAHVTAIAAMIPYLASGEYIQRGRSQVYLAVSLLALIFNTLSKLFTVKTAQRNFSFTSAADRAKFFVERCDGDGAEQLAKGAVSGIPVIASMRKTELLCDFILSTYCEDVSDRTSRKVSVITLAAALIGGVVAFFTKTSPEFALNNLSWAVTVCSAICAIGASFSGSMTVTLPLYLASRSNEQRGSAILGYNAVEDLSETNAVLVEAKTLFPPNAVKINNICGYDKPKNRCEGKINIDEAIIYAASLAVASDSVLADALFNMLNYKQEMLKPVSGCIYENNLGVMGWIDRRRVLLGNRQHMKSHEITVPNNKKEAAANVNNDEVIYLAVGGEVCLLFFVQLKADPVVTNSVQNLCYRDISLVIKTVDGMISTSAITELFEVDAENVKILPFEAHETFNEHTKFASSGSAAVSCRGTFQSFTGALVTSRNIRGRSILGSIIQASFVALGILLAVIFMLFVKDSDGKANTAMFGMFNMFNILFYNLGSAIVTLGAQFFKRP